MIMSMMYDVIICRLLENEIQRVQKTGKELEKELRQQIDELKKDNNRQQKLIGQVCDEPTLEHLEIPYHAFIYYKNVTSSQFLTS